MVYDTLQKRTAYLDSLAHGLEVLGVKILISMFPDVCQPVFVCRGVGIEGGGTGPSKFCEGGAWPPPPIFIKNYSSYIHP